MKTRTHTCTGQIPTRPLQGRGKSTHNNTQTLYNLCNYTMRHKILSLLQRRKKLHTHTPVHHQHTMVNPNTLTQEHKTQAQPWVGFVSSSDRQIAVEYSDKQNADEITVTSQPHTESESNLMKQVYTFKRQLSSP